MSEESSELSFDRAVYAHDQAAAPCASCAQPLAGQYWTYQSQLLCAGCRARTAEALRGPSASLGRAFLLGGLSALGCGIAYALFVHFTDYQLALITIGIAFVVGQVVRKASGGLGGLRYQILAVALTYFASAMGYFPAVWSGFGEGDAAEENERDSAAESVPPAAQAATSAAQAATSAAQAATSAAQAATPTAQAATPMERAVPAEPAAPAVGAEGDENAGISMLIGIVLLFAVTMAAPVLSLFEAPLGFLIVLFGLWEAWKLTRPVSTTIEGPFQVANLEPATT